MKNLILTSLIFFASLSIAQDTLFIASSYSGNTEETIAALKKAQ